ncbi:MAG: TM2 domain-containing protein [Cyanobacteria bacterium P01_F01_bin.42]
MRKKDTAYILWCSSFFGICGIHRFYLGKPVSGLFYLFTFGFFGLGQLLDLLLIPKIVNEKNRHEQLLPPPQQPSAQSRLDVAILKLCRDRNGATLSDCVMDTSAAPQDVKQVIHQLCVDDMLAIANRESDGAVIYRPI